MARPHHTLDTVSLQTFEPLSPTCLTCGKAAHIAYHRQRMVTTLSGHHRLHLWQCAAVSLLTVYALSSPIGQRRKEHGHYYMKNMGWM
ncbi:hypothetical protein EPA93_35515 [Ktedonosporobacter rubrisoli]|uniref:Uncharacterized protein n=1 Tax=Ktedonosporobacter rubrisoli TaxID=2509675 RepID=A0A4P6JZF5_KTERU|nr:hypothetical protein EPA93_35515 [Ktedonosporobacter rubrisoli]